MNDTSEHATMVLIFWNFLIIPFFVFFPQVKQSVIINNKKVHKYYLPSFQMHVLGLKVY